ncbi:cysteine proteinase [Peniophora sp. CONT]|nr:cysteine proteinase [Peniophora sp. CONT]
MDTHDLPLFPICWWSADGRPDLRPHPFLVWDKSRNRVTICQRHTIGKPDGFLLEPVLTLSLMGRPIKLTRYTHGLGTDDLRCPVLSLRIQKKTVPHGELPHAPRNLHITLCRAAISWNSEVYDDMIGAVISSSSEIERLTAIENSDHSCLHDFACSCVRASSSVIGTKKGGRRSKTRPNKSGDNVSASPSQPEGLGSAQESMPLNPADMVIARSAFSTVRIQHIVLLDPGQWLNDELVNYGSHCLHMSSLHRAQTLFLPSFFHSTLTGSKGGAQRLDTWNTVWRSWDPTHAPYVVMPYHSPQTLHFVLFFIIFELENEAQIDVRLYVCDSLENGGRYDAAAQAVGIYLLRKAQQRLPVRYQELPEVFHVTQAPVPKQPNGYDCGVHVLMNARTIFEHPGSAYQNALSPLQWDRWDARSTRSEFQTLLQQLQASQGLR